MLHIPKSIFILQQKVNKAKPLFKISELSTYKTIDMNIINQ